MRKQRGVTMIGWIFLLIPMAIVLYAALRAGPKYMDYYKAVTALKETATQLKSDETLTPQAIQAALERKFTAGYVDNVAPRDVQIQKGDNGWEMTIDYEDSTPLFGNLQLVMAFNKTIPIN